ncbi:MAG TPA: hypothetical protein VIH40_13555 [Xanthobacteraceae bacterium]
MAEAKEAEKEGSELRALKRRRNYVQRRLKEIKNEVQTLRAEKKQLADRIKELKPSEETSE